MGMTGMWSLTYLQRQQRLPRCPPEAALPLEAWPLLQNDCHLVHWPINLLLENEAPHCKLLLYLKPSMFLSFLAGVWKGHC